MRVKHEHTSAPVQRVAHIATALLSVRHVLVPTTTISNSPVAYHEAQNWRFENQTWKGIYRAGAVQCPGEIWRHYNKVCARIRNVPEAILNGSHAACFTPDWERRGWHRVHFRDMPTTVDGAILAVEQTIQESQHE